MKFKDVFIIFNIFIVVFMAALIFMPFFMFGEDLAKGFWKSSWYLIVILVVVLFVFNAYFLTNRKLYSLLEKEDWPALVHHLEDMVLRRGKYKQNLVKLLANTYLLLSDSSAVINLENKLTAAKPRLITKNALIFGTARILFGDFRNALHFFEEYSVKTSTSKNDDNSWMRWFYGFTLLLDKQYENGAEEFMRIAKESLNMTAVGLCAYFFGNNLISLLPERVIEFSSIARQGKERVLKTFPEYSRWEKECKKLNAQIFTAVLVKYLDETGRWLYNSSNEDSRKVTET